LALISLILIPQPELPLLIQAWVLGALAAVAFLTRLDALVLCPTILWAWQLSRETIETSHLFGLVLPVVVAFLGCSWQNWKRYRIPFPDTTVLFNLALMGKQFDHPEPESPRLERLISQTRDLWEGQDERSRLHLARQMVVTWLSHPISALTGILRRLLAFCGPESFISQKLFSQEDGAYPEISPYLRRALQSVLRFGFSLLLCLAGGLMLINRPFESYYILPTAGMFVVAFLFHMRTRYRLALLPGLSLLVADRGMNTVSRLTTFTAQDALVAVLGLALLLLLLFMKSLPTATSRE
jgi:hypothetical protein